MKVLFRQEHPNDYEPVKRMIIEAFKATPVRSGSEVEMVHQLRKETTFNPKYSRVATQGEEIIGHIILSQVYIINGHVKTPVLSLGLVSIAPHKQRRGIGAELIKHAIKIARDDGHKAIIVLGHPTYYPKIGFKRASTWGIELPFEAPDESFFAYELMSDSLSDTSGIVEYTPVFFGM